jgi:hypothetical protein
LANPYNENNLQTAPFFEARFCPKIEAFLQINVGTTKTISHFFSRFYGFPGFLPLQVVLYEQQAAIQPLQKKSCQKHYRRFFVCSGMCHNHHVKVDLSDRDEGREDRAAVVRQPASRAKRFGLRNDSSAFGRRAGIIGRISGHGFRRFHGCPESFPELQTHPCRLR